MNLAIAETDWHTNPRAQAYLELVRKWNRLYSLVSQRDISDLYRRHVENSLDLLPHMEHSTRHLDIGSGGGFPGIPLAIARPSMKVVLNDRSQKKCRFLRQVKLELGLENAEVFELNIEPCCSYGRRFDSVTARAVGPPEKAWSLGKQFLDRKGVVLLQTANAIQQSDVPGGVMRASCSLRRGWVSVVARSRDAQ